MLSPDMQHVETRTYHLDCNWKVFADNYLVRSADPPLSPRTMCTVLVIAASAISSGQIGPCNRSRRLAAGVHVP